VKSRDRSAYTLAGVDIAAADKTTELIIKHAKSTFRPEVLTDIGLFGSMFEFKGYKQPVLVSSADGVGTKIKIAALSNKHDTVGIDLVNHCVNDILCCGAEPLFFLDYIAAGKLIPERIEKIVSGLSMACRNAGCALIGGETAEMPGMYHGDDYDLVGFIVGAVEKEKIIDGDTIVEDDIILGLPSSGLHTNGYSLVRKTFGIDQEPAPLEVFYNELGRSLGEELLIPHRCYYPQLKSVLPLIKGLAHITGGGFNGNIPRILPEGLCAHINKSSWHIPSIFTLTQKKGDINETEMYQVFNMGIGMVAFCSPQHDSEILSASPKAIVIGKVVKSPKGDRIIIE